MDIWIIEWPLVVAPFYAIDEGTQYGYGFTADEGIHAACERWAQSEPEFKGWRIEPVTESIHKNESKFFFQCFRWFLPFRSTTPPRKRHIRLGSCMKRRYIANENVVLHAFLGNFSKLLPDGRAKKWPGKMPEKVPPDGRLILAQFDRTKGRGSDQSVPTPEKWLEKVEEELSKHEKLTSSSPCKKVVDVMLAVVKLTIDMGIK